MFRSASKSLFAALRSRPTHALIAQNVVLISIFVGISKVFGAAKEAAIAFYYGTGVEVEAYVIAFAWVMWLPVVWQGAVVLTLVPLMASVPQDEARRFLQELLGLTVLLGIVFSLIAAFVFPLLIQAMLPNSSPEVMRLTVVALRGMAPAALLSTIAGVLFAFLLGKRRHLNTLIESLPSAVLLIFLLVWPAPVEQSLAPLVLGSLTGFVVMLAALLALAVRIDTQLAPRFSLNSSAWKGFWYGSSMVAANQLLLGFVTPLDQAMASQLGEGTVAIMNYSLRLQLLILGLTTTAIGRAVLPVFSSLHAGNSAYSRRVAAKWAEIAFVIGVLIALAGWIFATPGVRLFFERGAFTAQDTQEVIYILRYGLLYVPFYLVHIVFTYFLAARKDYGFLAVVAGVMITVKWVGNYWFISWLGLPAIQVTSLMMYITGIALYLWRIELFARPACRI